MKICECITSNSFVLTGGSVFALINSSIRRYLCGITQLKLNEAIVLVKKLNEAIVLVLPFQTGKFAKCATEIKFWPPFARANREICAGRSRNLRGHISNVFVY